MEKDITTEEKIKEAARKIFLQKGFAGTRTRDIAEEAGINLALLNYYYRSKEKLFEIVMEESLKQLFLKIILTLNDKSTDLSSKINIAVDLYIDILKNNPNLPLFILSEIQANPEKFKKKIGFSNVSFHDVEIIKQIKIQLDSIGLEISPLHIVVNLISMTIFPFAAKPLLKIVGNMDETAFNHFLEERRVLIPLWIKSILKL